MPAIDQQEVLVSRAVPVRGRRALGQGARWFHLGNDHGAGKDSALKSVEDGRPAQGGLIAERQSWGALMKQFRVFSIALLAIQALALAGQVYAAGAATEAPIWHRYQSPDGRISATLPVKPQITTSAHGYRLLAAPNDRVAYIVAYRRLQSSVEGQSERVFVSVLNAFREKGYTVIGRQRVRVDGHPGQEVHIKTKDGFFGWDRMFLVGDGFYQLLYMDEQDGPAPARFWRSMVLKH